MRPLLCVVLAAGCAKLVSLDGVVIDGRGSPGGLQRPLDGATAVLTCPDTGRSETRVSGAAGHVKIILGRRFHRGCELVVSMPGYETARAKLGEICPAHEDEPASPYCGRESVVVVRLLPRGS